MAQIKFVRGIKNNYKAEADHLDAIFFATDTHELLVNGEVYGLGRAVSDITYNAEDGSFNLTFVGNIDEEHNKPQNITIDIPTATGTNPGLMSDEDKAALDKLVGSGDGSIKDLIQDAINELKTTVDAYTVNGQAISTNPVLDGTDILLTNYTQAGGDTTAVAAADTVNQAIAKVENANTNTQNALEAFIATKGIANGIASLDENGKVPASQLNGQLAHVFGVDGVCTEAELASQSPEEGDIYYTTDTKKFYNYNGSDWDEPMDPKDDTIYNFRNSDKTGDTGRKNILYRWDGKDLVEISESLALGETAGTAYEGSKGKANRDALNSIPTTVVTGFGLVTPDASNVSIAFTDSDKNAGNNQYAAADGGNIVIPAATASKAGVMTAADKTYIDEVKTVLGNDASALGNVLKVNNAGIGILAGYSTAAAAADIEPEDTINQALGKLEKALNDLTGEGGEGSIQEQIQSAIDAIKDGASTDYDTLLEIENAIKNKEVTAIQYDNATRILTLVKAGGNLTVTLPEATSASAGLMSAADKAALDKAVADITDNKVVAADTSIVVGTDNTNTNTTIKVKVKEGNNALKLDGEGLFVDQAALTSYEGLNAITITDKADSAGVKEVALKISANDKVLSQNADGLLATFSIAKLGSANEGYAASYQLQDKSGNAMGVTIDIPKDMVVSAGEVKTVEIAEQPYAGAVVGDKYIDLTIANATSSHIYIPVKDLVDVYTAGNGIDVSGSNVISAKIDAATEGFLTVGANGIKLAGVQDAINTAKGTIDAYTVNDTPISENPVLNGENLVLTGYTPVTGGTVAAADTINAAINKLETSLVWYTV